MFYNKTVVCEVLNKSHSCHCVVEVFLGYFMDLVDNAVQKYSYQLNILTFCHSKTMHMSSNFFILLQFK